MISKHSWPTHSSELLNDLNYEYDIENSNNDKKTNGCNTKGSIFSTFALILNVYATENCLYDNETFSISDSITKAHEYLRNVFTMTKNSKTINLSLSYDDKLKIDYKCTVKTPLQSYEKKCWFSILASKYLQNYQKFKENSLYKNTKMKFASTEPIIFFFDCNLFKNYYSYNEHNNKYMNITCISMKLNKFQTFDCQRIKADIYSNYYKIWPKFKDQNTNTTQTLIHERQSDKAIQCSKSNEFLQISPDIKFASRSSLVINMDPKNVKYRQYLQQHRCSEHISKRKFVTSVVPSLEYIANYKPNFCDKNKQNFLNLRSFSTCATFGFQKRILKTRRVADNVDNTLEDKDNCNTFLVRSKLRKHRRGSIQRLKNTINRTENELIKYSSFIEDDLISFRHNNRSKMTKKLRSRNLEKSDILMVKKILLDDYITEVREIIHSEGSKMEGSQETKILENLKKRMDIDPVEVKFSASMQEFMCPTLSSRSSNCCSFIPHSDDCDKNIFLGKSNPFFDKNLKIGKCCYVCQTNGQCLCKPDFETEKNQLSDVIKLTKSCVSSSIKKNLLRQYSSGFKNKNYVCEFKKVKKNHRCNLEVKSILSTDLGVQVDFSHLYNDWQSLNDLNVNTSQDKVAKLSSRSYSDDVLYQRVENAVRIFTEKLILCERRIGDRSKIQKRQQDEPWLYEMTKLRVKQSHILATDHSANNTCIYPSNTCCTSEDEHISGISTSSFISLTDSEILPAFKMSI